ncbi:YcgL domain-containing protein [Pseudoalteromonas denitrificans]|uniref:YcgL domain-containing protein SAMN02745724_00998 n=1 Tax=Pseudoalteromonas denitrificans DSM 6059 TaxID=1123010 RepID=A0A1I1GR71_9GAMM|nr:YcgL domain-containing protein [Pseudoalteromonas denitrificans]SFC13965.1 hypothetical protein SAMN02745724_00998 [Pseudoalteromonas denitrificans DSM 6059]
MLSAIYKSSRKADTYLFVEKRDDFTKVPQALLDTFSKPVFVMIINLATRDTLAGSDIEKVKHSLAEQGYYLQLPPPVENMLETFRNENGANNLSN